MGYSFKGTCYEQQADALQAVVDDCGIQAIGTTGTSTTTGVVFCSVSGSSIQFKYLQPGNANPATFTYLYPVTFGSCTYSAPSSSAKFSNQDVIDMSWLVVSVWVVAWGIRKMIEVIRR